MPRFQPDLTKARASIRIFDRGEYELKIVDAEPFINEREGKDDSAGCRYNLEVVGKVDSTGKLTDEFAGEVASPNRVYVHTDKAWGMAKQFLMAAAGYSRDEEDKFDEEVASKIDLSIDGDGENVEAGNGWESVVGNHVRVTMDKRLYEGNEQQDYRGWTPANQKKSRRR